MEDIITLLSSHPLLSTPEKQLALAKHPPLGQCTHNAPPLSGWSKLRLLFLRFLLLIWMRQSANQRMPSSFHPCSWTSEIHWSKETILPCTAHAQRKQCWIYDLNSSAALAVKGPRWWWDGGVAQNPDVWASLQSPLIIYISLLGKLQAFVHAKCLLKILCNQSSGAESTSESE